MLIKYIRSVLWRVAKCLSYIEEARCLKVKVIRIVISLFEKAHHRIIPVYTFTALSNAFCIVHRRAGKIALLFQALKTPMRVKSRHDFITQRMLVKFQGILYLVPSPFWYVDAFLYILDLSSFALCYHVIHLRLSSKSFLNVMF